MTYPIPIVIDKTAKDLEDSLSKLSKERNIDISVMELVLYKVLADVQKEKLASYAENCIALQNELDSCKKTEDKDG